MEFRVSSKRVIVVGGGAAGLMAAGRAAELGAEVVLLERMRQVGRKIRISGKGRCNLTNTLPVGEFIGHFGKGGKFLRQALTCFHTPELVEFMHALGCPTEVQRGGRIFPASGNAVDVAHILRAWVVAQGVELITGARVRGVDILEGHLKDVHYDLFAETGTTGGGPRGSHALSCQALILATGGKSYPSTGSTGDGYEFARTAGHTIIKPRPSLVPLQTPGAPLPGVVKLGLRNIEAVLWVDGKVRSREFGELYVMDVGLSGPVILELSRLAVAALDEGFAVELGIDLKPALDVKKLDLRLIRDLESRPVRTWADLLKGLLPEKLIPTCRELVPVDPDKPAHQVTGEERRALRNWLKDYRLPLTGYGGFKSAIVTAGGVSTREVDPRTLESKVLPGLYLAGELLDLDADTGGFNMMGAFATGRAAGEAAAQTASGAV